MSTSSNCNDQKGKPLHHGKKGLSFEKEDFPVQVNPKAAKAQASSHGESSDLIFLKRPVTFTKQLRKAIAELTLRLSEENMRFDVTCLTMGTNDCIQTGQEAIGIMEDVLGKIDAGEAIRLVWDILEQFSRLHLSAYFYQVEDYYRNVRKGNLEYAILTYIC